MTRWNGHHSFHDRPRLIHGTKLKVAQNPGGIRLSWHESRLQKRSNLRSKNEILIRLVIVQRLDSHGISRQKKPLSYYVPEGKCEHAAQPRQARLAPHAISGQNHFSVGMTLELDAGPFEFLSKFAEVVDLAVEDDPVAADRILHRLVPERREVENR